MLTLKCVDFKINTSCIISVLKEVPGYWLASQEGLCSME